ncbi:MAG: RNA pyrophosphohydrolase [Arenicellales bacterium]|jgi:putative (di)nucleoside polyphosphate hydrolase|nr:RNA pyrophosphohydrolase [Arenicellales bacterium]MDP6435162.1 RNA pyrophosphohydrolase [Arenicellales bacterium]MDP6671520.1 RNA pyrophosphohydrolase [Arenicellales bacterium]MDP6724534.1 RNA pyrophosphohydrolase [Arenicellales bacterium]MDP7154911.1 RNA pyrophosphohydrolase [Arenicellales bacterium]|tara:strand:+ start:1659 stop:2192 length:534 start_codon:yes stop_codon:yes gene_type:complete
MQHKAKNNKRVGLLYGDGYRPNVGIIIFNDEGKLLWARRVKHDGWQFPQGGVERGETVQEAVFRELEEEVGLCSCHVQLVGRTRNWLHYDVPSSMLRSEHSRGFKGQKQHWFLFHLLGKESDLCLEGCDRPEFDDWKWVDYWMPLDNIVIFKRDVYKLALKHLEPLYKSYRNRTLAN